MYNVVICFVSGRERVYSFVHEEDANNMKNSLVGLMQGERGCYWMKYWDKGQEEKPNEIVINPANVEQVILILPK